MKGKFFVIDGGDGSGKTEQARLLVARMRSEKLAVGEISFPRYETPTGNVVKAYLEGAFGEPTAIDAKQASTLYAIDRWAAFKQGVFAGLTEGEHLVANRYVASNMGHQGSKFDAVEDRRAFFAWNDALEHGTFGIPRPDLNIILHVPAEISMRLITSRGNAQDGHETLAHLKRAEATYLEIAASFPGFVLIECVRNGELLPMPAIHELVWNEVQKHLDAGSTP